MKWSKLSTATIHKTCKTIYVREINIQKSAQDHASKCVEGRSILKSAVQFNYENLCFICGESCGGSRQKAKLVMKDETKDNLIAQIKDSEKSDAFYKNLLARLKTVKSLVEVNARYHSNCMSKCYTKRRLSDKLGRPLSDNTTTFIKYVINFIDNNCNEVQFSLNEIKEEYSGSDYPCLDTIKNKLREYYPDGQIKFINTGTDIVILFTYKISHQTWKDWYTQQNKDKEIERKRILEMAACILLEDIRKNVYATDEYIIPNFDENNIFELIPESLVHLLSFIIKSQKIVTKANEFKWSKKVATISHTIISSSRPCSFLSPILIGLTAMMHKKYGSKALIDSLSNVGLCASYGETLRIEASIVNDPNIHAYELNKIFAQFIFDNADVNMATLDGKNTFHAMGGLKVVTPSANVRSKRTIARITKIPSSKEIGKFGFTPLKRFDKKISQGLKNTFMKDLFSNDSATPKLSMEDFT